MSFLSVPYVNSLGKKPSRPAFLYQFHNDDDGGTTVVDQFGNCGNLTIQGTLGTAWTVDRGWITPNGTNVNAVSADYTYAVSVMNVITPGTAFIVAFRWWWETAKTTSTEIVLQLGRSHSSANMGAVLFGLNSSGILQMLVRGKNASAVTGYTFGSSSFYVANQIYSGLIHVEVTATGLKGTGYLDGVNVGTQQTYTWTDNGGTAPTAASDFSDGITLLSSRTNVSTYSQYVGATTGAKTRIANVLALNLSAPDLAFAQALATELEDYPRYVGTILRSA